MSVNKVILVGNVGKDPEIRYLESGVAVGRFPLATSESYKGRDGDRVTTTEWHNIVVWRGLAEVVEKYVKKGSQLYIEGKIRTRSYDDKDGNKRYVTEITADQMQMLGKRGDSDDSSQSGGQQGVTEHGQSSVSNRTTSGSPEANSDTTGKGQEESDSFDSSTSSGDDLPF